MMKMRILFFGFFFMSYLFHLAIAEVKQNKQLLLQNKETNAVNFVRLVIMRLVFGIASTMGLGENLSGLLGGIFVPPGSDYDDYYGDFISDLFR